MRTSLLLTLIGLCAGCVTTQLSAQQLPVIPDRSSADRISRAQIDSVLPVDAYDAVALIRPAWLKLFTPGRGARVGVYIDSVRKTSVEDLRIVPRQRINTIEFVTAPDLTQLPGAIADSLSGAIVVRTQDSTPSIPSGIPDWFKLNTAFYPMAVTHGGASDWEEAMLANGWTSVSGDAQQPRFWMWSGGIVVHHVFLDFMMGNEWPGRTERYRLPEDSLSGILVGDERLVTVHYKNRFAGVMVGVEWRGFRAGWARVNMTTVHKWYRGGCECQGSSIDNLKPGGNIFEVAATRNIWKSIALDARLQQHSFDKVPIAVGAMLIPPSVWDGSRTLFTIGLGTRLKH